MGAGTVTENGGCRAYGTEAMRQGVNVHRVHLS